MEFKYVISQSTNVYENLAQEQLLMKQVHKGICIIMFWKNDKTIVIGRNQNMYQECKYEEFIKTGGLVSRRFSGGGAVFHDNGNLNISFIYNKENEKKIDAYRAVANSVSKQYKIEVTYNNRNDLLVDNRKISGFAIYERDNICCLHGTVMIDVNIADMEYYLTPDKEKLGRNGVDSVRSRVVNLKYMDEYISSTKIIEGIIFETNAKEYDMITDQYYIEKMVELLSNNQWVIEGKI